MGFLVTNTSPDLVFTCFPERVQQPENDPLNVFRGVIDDLNSTTRAVSSAFELAATITNRCMGTFARHQLGLQEYSFLEMIDMTIGTLVSPQITENYKQNVMAYHASRLVGRQPCLSASSKMPL